MLLTLSFFVQGFISTPFEERAPLQWRALSGNQAISAVELGRVVDTPAMTDFSA